MKLENVPLGATVNLYVRDGCIQQYRTNDTVSATVVAINVVENALPTRYLLGWDNRPSYANKYLQGLDYTDFSDARGLLRVFNLDRMDQFIPGHHHYAAYKLHPNIGTFVYGKFVYYGMEVHSIHDTHFGSGPIVSPAAGPLKFIAATDIRQGDTVAWFTETKNLLTYAIVYDVDEGEDMVENAIIVLNAKVFCKDGILSYPNGYPLQMESKVLLVNRTNNG